MPNDPVLYPDANDPTGRLYSRMAQLEQRIAALEATRDPIITPVQVQIGPSSPVSFNFTWYGGALQAFFGASAFIPGAALAGASVGIGDPLGTDILNLSQSVLNQSAATFTPFPFSIATIDTSHFVPGVNTLTARASVSSGTLSATINLVFIESPH